MKGLTGSAGAVAVIALGLYPGSRATSLRHEPVDHGPTNGGNGAELESTNALDGGASRRLQSRGRRLQAVNEDALDVNGTVSDVILSAWNYSYRLTGIRTDGGMPAAYKLHMGVVHTRFKASTTTRILLWSQDVHQNFQACIRGVD